MTLAQHYALQESALPRVASGQPGRQMGTLAELAEMSEMFSRTGRPTLTSSQVPSSG